MEKENLESSCNTEMCNRCPGRIYCIEDLDSLENIMESMLGQFKPTEISSRDEQIIAMTQKIFLASKPHRMLTAMMLELGILFGGDVKYFEKLMTMLDTIRFALSLAILTDTNKRKEKKSDGSIT